MVRFLRKRASFKANLSCHGEARPHYTIEGNWLDEFVTTDIASGSIIERHKVRSSNQLPLKEAPIEEQDPWETHKA